MFEQRCDVLVIGGGGAGLRAAIEARDALGPEGRVVLVTKGTLGKSGVTARACSDRMAFHATLPYTEPGGTEAWRYHADDIYRIGQQVSDADLAGILARGSNDAFAYLDALGVPFVKRADGRADQFVTDGSVYARACYTGPYTAHHIEEALVRKLRTMDVEVVDHCAILELLTSQRDGRVLGAVGLIRRRGGDRPALFRAGATILATGGAGKIYRTNVFPEGMTGEGYSMAYRAGAELVNMEFIQIGLCSVKTKLACSGSMMRALPRIVTDDGREFLREYFPSGTPLPEIHTVMFEKGASWPAMYGEPSVILDIAAFKEIVRGETVWLDYTENPEGLDLERMDRRIWRWYREVKGVDLSEPEIVRSPFERLRRINPGVVVWFKDRGIDLAAGGRIQIAPSAQHFQGGVKIDGTARTTVPGLFAAGEVAGGQHGAKRPGGNSLMDGQVFGKIAGRSAAEEAKRIGHGSETEERVETVRRAYEQAGQPSGLSASWVRRRVQDLLSTYASIVRTREGLEKGLRELRELRTRGVRPDRRGLAFARETEGMFDTAEMVLRAAARRDESRGCHLFFAGPEDNVPAGQDDARGQKYTVIRKSEWGMTLETRTPVRIAWVEG